MGASNGILVKAGQDRFNNRKTVFGSFPIDFKVATQDSDSGLFIIENLNVTKGGGPPRHLHFDQDEWFYAVEGDYLLEIGGKPYELGSGDSIFAPRRIPHAWAFTGKGRGKIIVAFQPAGLMEAFFIAMANTKGAPSQSELAKLFSEYGMEITGPPLF
jgi:quercetin dioxygenase-like cupin family protein